MSIGHFGASTTEPLTCCLAQRDLREGPGEARDWRLREALLTLHAIADEACAGLGVALYAAGADGVRYPARARELRSRPGARRTE